MYQDWTDQRMWRMWSVDLLVRSEGEGVGMAMMPTDPGTRTVHEIVAPLRRGGWLEEISRVLCTYLLHVDSPCTHAYFIYRYNCITFIVNDIGGSVARKT